MVFVKFHNMNQEKKIFLMSPLNSNKLTNFHFKTSQNNITITVHKYSLFFSLFFFQCIVYFTKKCSFFSFFLFFICCVQQCSSFLSFSLSLFHCPVPFFCFCFLFSFFFFIINCSFTALFFFNLISTSLCLYLNTITIGLLPSLFNFSLYFHKISQVYN